MPGFPMTRESLWQRVRSVRSPLPAMPRLPRASLAARYALAVVAVGLALGAKLLLARLQLEASPFLLFFAAVLVAASFGGLGPGLAATGLAALCGNFFFMPPLHTLDVSHPNQRVHLALFGAEGAIISGLNAVLHATRRRAAAHEGAARDLERRIVQISEAEQRRIGLDLHDGLGQHLTGVALLSRSLRQKLEAMNGDGHGTAGDARRVEALLNEAIAWTRDLASHLAPTTVEAGGLCPALADLAEGASALFGVRCRFAQEGGGDLEPIHVDDATAMHLYRIAQEAVSNAVKHGHAREILIALGAAGRELVLRVEANGAHLPDGWMSVPARGMGLKTMDYRARAIGGTLDVRNGERRGTVVTCRCPWGGAKRNSGEVRV